MEATQRTLDAGGDWLDKDAARCRPVGLDALKAAAEQSRAVKASPEPAVVHAALGGVSRLHPKAQHAWIDGFIADAAAVVTSVPGPRHLVVARR